MADLRKKQSDVAWLLIGTAGLVAVAVLMYPLFLPWLAQAGFDSRLQAVVASGALFAPASFLLGMISPYLAKLNVTSLKTSGSAVRILAHGILSVVSSVPLRQDSFCLATSGREIFSSY